MTRDQASMPDSAAWLGIVGHIVLALFKGIVGLLFDSLALLGDALYSASDAAAGFAEKVRMPNLKKGRNALVINAGPDTVTPPQAMFLSVILLMGGLQLAITSITAISKGNVAAPGYLAGVAVVISIAIKEALFRLQLRRFHKQGSDRTSSLVIGHRYSFYSSITVLVGVFGAMAGYEMNLPALLYFDPAAAILVSLLVIWRAYRIVKTSVYGPFVTDSQEEDASSFIETVQRVHGVIAVDDLIAKENGHYVMVIAKISVNPRITVMEAHEIATRAKKLLFKRFSHVSDVRIQVTPYDPGYPYKSNHDESETDIPHFIQ